MRLNLALCVAAALQCLHLVCSNTIKQRTPFLPLFRLVQLCIAQGTLLLCRRHIFRFRLYFCDDLRSAYCCFSHFCDCFMLCRGEHHPVHGEGIVGAVRIQCDNIRRFGYLFIRIEDISQ